MRLLLAQILVILKYTDSKHTSNFDAIRKQAGGNLYQSAFFRLGKLFTDFDFEGKYNALAFRPLCYNTPYATTLVLIPPLIDIKIYALIYLNHIKKCLVNIFGEKDING